MLRTNCELFLQSHFLTTHAVRLVPHGFQLDLQYIVLPGEMGQCATQYVIQREDKDTPETLTISDTPIAAKQFDFCLQSHKLYSISPELPVGSSVLITDIESELSDATNANNQCEVQVETASQAGAFYRSSLT